VSGKFQQTEIGKFPTSWEINRVDSAFEIQQGKQVSKKNREGENQRPFLRTKNVLWNRLDLSELDKMNFSKEEENRLELRPGDLFTCEGGDIGRTALWTGSIGRCYYQNHLHRLRSKNGRVDPQFAVYWFWYSFKVANLYFGRGNVTTIPNLSRSKLAELPMALPPLSEQKKIAHILSTVQQAIEAQEKIIQTTTELKKALMHKLFTEGLRGERQKQTEIGPVPESWEVVELGTLFQKQPQNGIYKHKQDYGSGTQILRIEDFSNEGDVVPRAGNFVALARSEIDTYGLEPGDIVINRVNSLSHLGKTALIGFIGEEMVAWTPVFNPPLVR
jgi:type I restriction enzyme S subunit